MLVYKSHVSIRKPKGQIIFELFVRLKLHYLQRLSSNKDKLRVLKNALVLRLLVFFMNFTPSFAHRKTSSENCVYCEIQISKNAFSEYKKIKFETHLEILRSSGNDI